MMLIKRRHAIFKKTLICGMIVLHINLLLPLSDFLPFPKAMKKVLMPEARADDPPPPSWSIVELHEGVDPSLAIDNSGKPHISFGQGTGSPDMPAHIFYGCKENGSWNINEVTSAVAKPKACAETSIAVDRNNKVHIAYALEWGHRVSYITNKSGDWQETIITGAWTGNYESFFMDDNGCLYLGWWNNTTVPPPPYTQQLNYKYFNGSAELTTGGTAWQATEGLGTLDVKRYTNSFCPSAIVAAHGTFIPPVVSEVEPHIIVGKGSGGLLHCYKDGGGWLSETFGVGYEILFDANSTLQVDSSNNLYCVVQNVSGAKSLYLAKKINGQWSYELITQPAAGSVVRASLVIDSQNKLHVAYFNGQKVYYGSKSGSAWAFQEAAAIANEATPGDISLALNSFGKPRIAYSTSTSTSKKIYYAEWDVHIPNKPPVIDSISAKTVNEAELLTFNVTAADPDAGDVLTYSLAPITGKSYPDGAVLNSVSGVFEWTPAYKQAGYYEANIKVSDGKEGEASQVIKITVLNVNTKPTVEITPSSFCPGAGADFTLHIDANDEDGDTLTYALKENGAAIQSGVIISGEPLPDITRKQTMAGIYAYTVTVCDCDSGSASASCSLEVMDASENPADAFPISGDFNGDGVTDIGTFNTQTGAWKVAISDKGKFNSVELWISDFKGKDYRYAYSLTGDFNGDGKADIALCDRQGGNWRFAFSDGEKFTHDTTWDLTGFGGGECSPLIGDFNGDGITDIGYADASAGNNGFFCIRLAKEDRTGFEDTAIPYETGLRGGATYAGDFNGDGLTDITAFDSNSGKWNVLISQDTTSTRCIDWIRDTSTIVNTTRGGPGNSAYYGTNKDTYDGDFNNFYGGSFAASNGSAGFKMTTIADFASTHNISKIVAKGYKYSQPSSGGYVKAYLYYSGAWHEIGDVVNSESGSGSVFRGDWRDVTKMKLESYGYSASLSTFTIWAKNYEFQAWGPADPVAAVSALPAFTTSAVWLTGFGADSEPVITDYNHDGKTDIGCFGGGQWWYAISTGNGFDSTIKATMGNINHGSHEDVYDGNYNTWAGFYDGGSYGSKSSATTTMFEWPDTHISSVKYRCASSSAIGSSGSQWNGWSVYLKINSAWVSIDSGSGDSGIKTKSNGWADCGGVKIETRAVADCDRECSIGTKNYEVQAIETLPDGTLVNKAVGINWPSPFGQGSNILPSGGDYNGDGIGDAAVFHRDRQGVLSKWEIKLHNSKQPDLLISVDNGIGGTTNIEYEVSTRLDNTGGDGKPDLPFPAQVVKRETKTDGIPRQARDFAGFPSLTGLSSVMGNSYTINYEYSGGMFEPNSREFRGFGHVKVVDSEGTVKETEFYQGDILKGRPAKEEVTDITGKIYSAVVYEWQEVNKAHGGASDFPYLISQTSTLYNHADGTSRDTKTVYSAPDVYGNVLRIDELGFVDDASDDRYTVIEYEYNTANYIVGKPKHTAIMKGSVKASEAWYRYDALGSLKEEEKWLDAKPAGAGNPITKFKYDYEVNPNNHCGNLIEVEDALGQKTLTTYEASYGYAFPVKVTNALGHAQSFTYDKKTGQILTSTDPNGQTSRTIYDTFGRTKKIIGPNDTEASPSVEYIYDLSIKPSKITTVTKVDAAKTAVSYAFMDGLGRTVEVKTEAENNGKQLVSGVVRYDPRGQVKEKYLSYFVTASPDYVPPNYEQLKVIYEYDPVGRVIETKRPDGASSFVQYEGWRVTAIDENSHKATSEKDAFGRLIKVIECNGNEEYLTRYQYDTLGNLTKTIDAQANETVITYDSLGRKISMNDPDMGHWTYDYDALGNLKKQTDAKGQVIEFDYDVINRLYAKLLRSASGGEAVSTVTYTYDEPAKPNSKGRLSKVTDSSGATEFFYDNLGREIKTVKKLGTVPSNLIRAQFFVVERTYDSIDRLKTVTYPDSEVVTYTYNKAGGVKTVQGLSPLAPSGVAGQGTVPYITNVDYNEQGQMTRVDYGNGTHTEYSYNPQTSRLENLSTLNAQQAMIQNLSYAFDNVGNVKSITDASSGGTNTQTFEYDALSRLTKAAGKSYGAINYKYDSIGNMLQNGNITMEYGPKPHCPTAGPHAAAFYTLSAKRYPLSYDLNGNMLSKETSSGVKQFTYDIENRLTEVTSPKEEYLSNYEIPLKPGWNFISLPIIVTENIPAILSYSGITKAQVSRYNAETKAWENFAYEQGKNLSQYNKFTTFDYGRGYEIYVDNACVIKITGVTPSSQRTLDLKAGWNLIAAPTTSSIDAEKMGTVPAKDCPHFYERQGDNYIPVTTLIAGKAYFLKVSNDQTWNIPREQEVTTYAYDGDGGRVKVVTPTETTTYVGSLYESTYGVAEGLPVGGTTVSKKHIFLGSTRICTVENLGLSQTTQQGTVPNSSTIHYYHQDHIGSSNVITDETGKVAKLIEYSPYGLTSREEGAYNTNYRFTGKLFDTSTALYYYGARYYDPELGRFIQPDTIVPYPDDPQSFNRYSYCRNNPITYIDPTGHIFGLDDLIIGIIVGAIIGGIAALATGGNVWTGMAAGAVGGALFGAVGLANVGGLAHTIGHAAAGALSGGIGSVIQGDGGNAFQGMLIGGFSAGASEWMGTNVPFLRDSEGGNFADYLSNMTKRAVIGATVGGATSVATGGDFWQGAALGGSTSAIAYTANDWMHRVRTGIGNIRDWMDLMHSSFKTVMKFEPLDITAWPFLDTNYGGITKSGPGEPRSPQDALFKAHDDTIHETGTKWWSGKNAKAHLDLMWGSLKIRGMDPSPAQMFFMPDPFAVYRRSE